MGLVLTTGRWQASVVNSSDSRVVPTRSVFRGSARVATRCGGGMAGSAARSDPVAFARTRPVAGRSSRWRRVDPVRAAAARRPIVHRAAAAARPPRHAPSWRTDRLPGTFSWLSFSPREPLDDATTTDSRAPRIRSARRGGQRLTRARGSRHRSGLPTLRAPRCPCPGWSHRAPIQAGGDAQAQALLRWLPTGTSWGRATPAGCARAPSAGCSQAAPAHHRQTPAPRRPIDRRRRSSRCPRRVWRDRVSRERRLRKTSPSCRPRQASCT